MSLPLIILIAEYVIICACNYKIRGTLFDAFFFVMSPYVFIIAINNLFMGRLGFLEVSDSTVWLHVYALLAFYIGALLGGYLGGSYCLKSPGLEYTADEIDSRLLTAVSIVSILYVLADYMMLIRSMGLGTVLSMGDTLQRSMIASHLLICFLPLMILLVEFFFKEKKLLYLVLAAVMLCLIFTTFVKYHIVSSVLALFFYVTITRPKYVKTIGSLVLVFIVGAFVLNYLISFAANRNQVANSFYILHLWKYIGGGTTNIDNVLEYTKGDTGLSFVKWLLSMVGSFPAMIFSRLFGQLELYQFSTTLPLFNVADPVLAEQSNVVSFLGAAYAQTTIPAFLLFIFLWGWIVQLVYENARATTSLRNKTVASIFLGYNMLSFFSSFFELSNPWESMIMAWLIVTLLRIKL